MNSNYRISPFWFFSGAFLLGGLYFALIPSSWILTLSGICIWLGSMQILNRYAPLFPDPIPRGIHWLHAMSFEGFAVAGIVLSHCARLFGWTKKPSGFPLGRPILLVHGYFNDSTVWLYQKKQLQDAGLGPIYTIDLGYPFHSILTYSEKIAEKAQLIAEETGREDLVLIGYSMGGLVCAWYALKKAPVGKVTDVVAIGSPFFGTPVAKIGIGRNAREMQRNSDFIQKIRKEIEANQQIRFYYIVSKSDEISFPGEKTGRLGNDPSRYLVLEDVGHAGLIYSDRVSQKICGWLQNLSQ